MQESEHQPIDPRDEALAQRLPADANATFDPARAQTIGAASSFATAQPAPATPDAAATPRPSSAAAPQAFQLLTRVGRGGMGEVWRARQESLHRTIAVKTIRADLLAALPDEAARAQAYREFVQEAVTTASLEHPNIVPVYDLGGIGTDRSPMLAMKLVDGESWDAVLKRDRPAMNAEDFLAKHLPILIAVSQAVAFAHSRGLVHRDLKPSQVMLGGFGEVLLMDWGLAMLYDRAAAERTLPELLDAALTPTSHTASNPSGTPAYMAPEQTDPTAERIGPHTDVFLLGATLYYILTGVPPHSGARSIEVFLKARQCAVVPPAVRAADRFVPEELQALAMHAMNAEPSARVPSALAFVDSLQQYLSGSGRRRESAALTERTAAALETARDYEALADCGHTLDQAAALWPGNPALPPLRERALRRYAETAIANGDLVLARLQAQRIDSVAVREPILQTIARRLATIERNARQRRMLQRATAALLFVVLAAVVLVQREQSRRLEEAAARRVAETEAARERERAEESTRTSALLREIETLRTDEVNLAQEIRAEARDWSELVTARGNRSGLSTLTNLLRDDDAINARLLKRLEAVRARRASLELRVGKSFGPEPIGFRLFEVNAAFNTVGNVEEGMRIYPTLRQLAAEMRTDPEPLLMMAMLEVLSDNMTSAALTMELAVDRSATRDGRESVQHARVRTMQGNVLGLYLRSGDRGGAIIRSARQTFVTEIYRLALALAQADLALDDSPFALESADIALRAHHRLANAPPNSRLPLLTTKGRVLVDLGRYEEAEPLLREAYESLRKTGGPGHQATVNALFGYVSLLTATGREAEALRLLEEASAAKPDRPRSPSLTIELRRQIANLQPVHERVATLEALVADSAKTLGSQSGMTLLCEESLLRARSLDGDLDRVRLDGPPLYERLRGIFGEDHRRTIALRQLLAEAGIEPAPQGS